MCKFKGKPSLLTTLTIFQLAIIGGAAFLLQQQDRRVTQLIEERTHCDKVLRLTERLEKDFSSSLTSIRLFSIVRRGAWRIDDPKAREECERIYSERYADEMTEVNKSFSEFKVEESRHRAQTGMGSAFFAGHHTDDIPESTYRFFREVFEAYRTTAKFQECDDGKVWHCSLACPYRNLRQIHDRLQDELKKVAQSEELALSETEMELSQVARYKQDVMISTPLTMLLFAILFRSLDRRNNRKRAQRVDLLRSNIQGVADGREPIPLSGDDDLAAIDGDFRAVASTIFEEQWKRHETAWNATAEHGTSNERNADNTESEDLSNES